MLIGIMVASFIYLSAAFDVDSLVADGRFGMKEKR